MISSFDSESYTHFALMHLLILPQAEQDTMRGNRCSLFGQLVLPVDEQRSQCFGIELIEIGKSNNNHDSGMP